MNSAIKLLTSIALVSLAGTAQAAIYSFSETDAHATCASSPSCFETGTGTYNNGWPRVATHGFNVSYDDVTHDFTFNATVSMAITPTHQNTYANSFWLSLSDGDMPDSSYAMLYGNSTNTQEVYAYEYHGANSWQNSSYHIETFENVLSDTMYTASYTDVDNSVSNRRFTEFSFSVNLANVNGQLANGLKFDETIGIWFQPSYSSVSDYGPGQPIKKFKMYKTGWYDTNGPLCTNGNPNPENCNPTTEVPEPAPMALMALGLFALGWSRRRS